METVNGFVAHIVYQNQENGYTVMTVESEGQEITCVGNLKGLTQGETINATGEYTLHPVYGKQFHIQQYQNVAPKNAADMERYLGSGTIKGVGIALAARIVKRFGEDTFRIIEEEPERLKEVRGISERMARDIGLQMEEKKELRDSFVFLSQFGLSNAMAVKIVNTYGDELYKVMQENPYRLAEDIRGVGFKTADEIAGKAGIRVDADYRVRAGILYTLMSAVGEGHCYLPREILLERAGHLLSVPEEVVSSQLQNLMMDQKIMIKAQTGGGDPLVYAASYYYGELNCARMLEDLSMPLLEDFAPEEETKLLDKVKALAKEQHMELDDLQQDTVLECIKNGLFILSGGPGTGKTTTINLMIRYFAGEGLDIFLAAPTGRAAKRMTEATGYEAKTIHRLLELNSALSDDETGKVRFERNQDNPLEADVVIIDEMSMVDLMLFQSLLKAIVPGTRLILVGDVNQLPSVGPGQVLRDLMNSGAFPMVVLQKIFRQAGESDIVVNAHRVNRGESIALDNKSKDFFMLERKEVNVIYKHMIQLIQEKLPGYVNAHPFDIQVLTPMRKGALGVETLNGILQQYLNPPAPGKKEYTAGSVLFREGDKVMQIKNNYQLEWEIIGNYGISIDSGMGVFNGDMGRITKIDDTGLQITVEFDEHRKVEYPYSLLNELELSYAITIHKAQGSEYPAVVLPLMGGPRLLMTRNLLYTAITRARNCVMILGSSDTVRTMIQNVSENRRYTAFADRIRELHTS
jgi:exodeoxyribonuclease V alpha subunit